MYMLGRNSGRSMASEVEWERGSERDVDMDAEKRADSDVDASTFARKSDRELQMGEVSENTGVIDFWCLYFMLKIGRYIQAV